ncbi:MAG: NADH-quinone oxidoreductase subunit L [Coriobacteriales bacterium]|jgi:NADH:ubiquinone oxidoreductase subunit 5 (subunit L)/multisubunit Na+/H+ antiporter MnhA subunit|nr:NADH-quinone oxidoreductase subunit L [Coriobacteriales bacterium]
MIGPLLLAILTPIIGAFILPAVGKLSEKLRDILALLFVMTAFFCSAALLPSALAGNPAYIGFTLPLGMSFGFLADNLAVFMAMISSFVGGVIVFYSVTYIDDSPHKSEYYLMVTLFLGAMMGLVYSTNLIFIYVFWEISAISCWRLIGYYREPENIIRADKAFLVTVFGALVMLVGFIFIYTESGTFDLTKMTGTEISNVTVTLVLFGIFSKSATLPLHTWLPDAGVAPAPVTSLLHAAVLVKIGIYAFARLFLFTFPLGDIWHIIVPAIAAASALVSAGAALLENDLKRIIAYSTVSQIGFIFLGLASDSKLGVAGGLLYILMHSLAKGGLFLCAGIIEHNAKTKDVRKLGGLIRTMPITAICFLVCSFSVMGLPPFGGFFSKFMVISGSINAGSPWISAVFVVGTLMTILYLMRAFYLVFLGQPKSDAREGSRSMVASVVGLAVLSLLGGLLIFYPSFFVQSIVAQIGWIPL